MYKTFLKNIKASIRDYYPVPELSNVFGIEDEKGNNISSKISKVIGSGKTLKNSDPILDLIAKSPTAALMYIAKKDTEERRKQILTKIPNLSLAFASDFKLAFQYIMYCLKGDPELDDVFFNYLLIKLKQSPSKIPAFIWITGYYDEDLINMFCDADIVKFQDIEEFLTALYKHMGQDRLSQEFKTNDKFHRLVQKFKEQLSEGSNNEDNIIDNTNESNSGTGDSQSSSIQNDTVDSFFSQLKDFLLQDTQILSKINVDKLNTSTDIENDASDIVASVEPELKDKFLNFIKEKADNVIDVLNSYTGYDNLKKFVEGLKLLTAKSKNSRGKNMFKLAKAYTRYYIKNMLPSMLKQAGNNPEETSKVIKVSTDEIQDLMYGDTVNHPENLAEVNNPAVRDQISFDVEQAVKGDQLADGAADGMSIEDIAKKWSEIYKQVPYEYLLEVLKTQEQAGSIVEQEHTDNLEIAKEIARDHLAEAPDYYTHLENMETLFPSENISEKPLPEPEGMDLQTLENPLPKNEGPDHVCDGSCGGNCKCHHDKVQTVEDKLQGLNGDGVMVIMVEETPEVQEEQPLEFIQQIAAKIKR